MNDELNEDQKAKGLTGNDAHDSANERHSKKTSEPIVKESTDETASQYDLKKLFYGIGRHYLLIIISAVLFSGVGIYVTHYLSTTYYAESILLFQEDKPKNINESQPMIFFSLPTLIELVKVPSHIESVKSILGLELSTSQLDSMVSVPVPKDRSNFLKVVAKGSNPTLVIDVANALAKVTVRDSQDFYQRQLQTQQEAFKNQYDRVHQKLIAQTQDIQDFKNQHQYYDMDPNKSSTLTEIEDVRKKLLDATLLYNGLVVEYENLKKESDNLPEHLIDEIAATSVLSPLDTQINAVNTSLIEARSKYAASNPKIKILEEQLHQLEKLAKTDANPKSADSTFQKNRNTLKEELNIQLLQMDSKVRGAQKGVEDLTQDLTLKERQLATLPKKQLAFAQLLQNKLITEEEMKTLDSSIQSLDLLINSALGGVEIYQLAQKAVPLATKLPFGPAFIDAIPVLALIAGVLLGFFIALILELFDSKMCTLKQLNFAYRVPALTIIPEMSFLTKYNAEDKTLYFIRGLSEQLDYICRKKTLSVLTITSALDNEGKSCLASNLASYYQRLGKRTILLSFDYHVTQFTPKSLNRGSIESYLRGKSELDEIIIPGNPDKIEVGEFDPELKELIKSDRMKQLLKSLKAQYDMIVIDAPGIIKSNYALNLAALSDKCLYIIGSSKTKKKYIDASLNELDIHGIKPCGIVLNRVLSAYIDDVRIIQENRRSLLKFVKSIFSGNRKKASEQSLV